MGSILVVVDAPGLDLLARLVDRFEFVHVQVTDPFSIRQAGFVDLEVVSTLMDDYRRFYGRASDKEAAQAFLQARFEHGQSVIFLAQDNATPIGFTQLYPSFSSASRAYGENLLAHREAP